VQKHRRAAIWIGRTHIHIRHMNHQPLRRDDLRATGAASRGLWLRDEGERAQCPGGGRTLDRGWKEVSQRGNGSKACVR
jgi:hypothetical protein